MAVQFCLGLWLAMMAVGICHARPIDLEAEGKGYYHFHGPICDRAMKDVIPFINVRARVRTGGWDVVGKVLGASETPNHILRLFVGPHVVTYVVGEEVQFEVQ